MYVFFLEGYMEFFNTNNCVYSLMFSVSVPWVLSLVTYTGGVVFTLWGVYFIWRSELMLRGRHLQAASLQSPAVNWHFRRRDRGRSSGVSSAQWDPSWGKHVCLRLVFCFPLSHACHRASSPLSLSLFKFASQPSGPEEHLCPSSFPICPVPLSLAPNSGADHLFISDMN